jgi:hypothetical protein
MAVKIHRKIKELQLIYERVIVRAIPFVQRQFNISSLAAQLRCAQVTEVLSGQVIDFSEEERGLLRSFKGLPKI